MFVEARYTQGMTRMDVTARDLPATLHGKLQSALLVVL